MARYRKKPIEVDALQWTGDNFDKVQEFLGPWHASRHPASVSPTLVIWVTKSRDFIDFPAGFWIIKEQDGSGVYPCASDVFDQTYEPVDAAPATA